MKTFINKVTFVAETTTPDGKTVRVILPESMVLDFSLGVGIKPQIVEELPEQGDPRIIYLVPAEDEKAGNIYVEWLYIDSKWECIGSTAVEMNLLIGTEEQRLALIDPKEGIEFNEVHAADPEDPESKAHVVRYIRENGEWVQLESPQTETIETVSLHVATYDGQGTLTGIQVGVTDRNSGTVIHRVLDANGNCSFEIPKGHTYVVSVAPLAGYREIHDQTFVASLDERSITLMYQSMEAQFETVRVHVTVYNNQLQDITSQDTDLIGIEVKCTVTDENDVETELTAIVGNDHTCQFEVEYGKTYTIKEPQVPGFLTRYATSWTHVASVPMREVPMHYVQWVNVGIYGMTQAGVMYTFEQMQQLSEQERESIVYIALNTSRLQAAGASFFYRLPISAPGKQWASANVEFDQTLLPFKQSHAAAVLDLNGEQNTENIIDIGDTMGVGTQAADYCRAETAVVNGETKHGFLGAYGQMYALSENITELNAIHVLLGKAAPGFTNGYWWTSTQYNAGSAVYLSNGGFYYDYKRGSNTTIALFALS